MVRAVRSELRERADHIDGFAPSDFVTGGTTSSECGMIYMWSVPPTLKGERDLRRGAALE